MINLAELPEKLLREQLSLQIVHHLASAGLQYDGHLNQHAYRGLGDAPFTARDERDIYTRTVCKFLLRQPEFHSAPLQLPPENFGGFGYFYMARHGHNRPSLRVRSPKHICFVLHDTQGSALGRKGGHSSRVGVTSTESAPTKLAFYRRSSVLDHPVNWRHEV